MIVDTSALMAVVLEEKGSDRLIGVLASETGLLPTPAYVEFRRVASRKPGLAEARATQIAESLLAGPMKLLPFDTDHAAAAAAANARYGICNAPGGTLNLLDLMVYACAKVERLPILCTGRDFAATDALIHPSSPRD